MLPALRWELLSLWIAVDPSYLSVSAAPLHSGCVAENYTSSHPAL